jgi:hypothetical protein
MPNIGNMIERAAETNADIRNSRIDFGLARDPSSILRSSRSEPYEIHTLSHYHHRREPSILRYRRPTIRLLPSERAALSQPRLATGRLAPILALA